MAAMGGIATTVIMQRERSATLPSKACVYVGFHIFKRTGPRGIVGLPASSKPFLRWYGNWQSHMSVLLAYVTRRFRMEVESVVARASVSAGFTAVKARHVLASCPNSLGNEPLSHERSAKTHVTPRAR